MNYDNGPQYAEQDAERMIRVGGFTRTRRIVRIWLFWTALSVVLFFCWLAFLFHRAVQAGGGSNAGMAFYGILPGVVPPAICVAKLHGAVLAYRKAFKQSYVLPAMKTIFTDLKYGMFWGIEPPEELLDLTKIQNRARLFRGEDHIYARFKDIGFEQSDIVIKDDLNMRLDRKKADYVLPVFRGQWMVFDFNKSFRCQLRVVQRGFHHARGRRSIFKKDRLAQQMETESAVFNKEFSVYAQNEHEAFYLLTPVMIERIQSLTAHTRGKMTLCFAGKKLHILIQNRRSNFEPGSIFLPLQDEKKLQEVRKQIEVTTQFIDELRLDNDLFQKQED